MESLFLSHTNISSASTGTDTLRTNWQLFKWGFELGLALYTQARATASLGARAGRVEEMEARLQPTPHSAPILPPGAFASDQPTGRPGSREDDDMASSIDSSAETLADDSDHDEEVCTLLVYRYLMLILSCRSRLITSRTSRPLR
jgi:hypothetical protein